MEQYRLPNQVIIKLNKYCFQLIRNKNIWIESNDYFAKDAIESIDNEIKEVSCLIKEYTKNTEIEFKIPIQVIAKLRFYIVELESDLRDIYRKNIMVKDSYDMKQKELLENEIKEVEMLIISCSLAKNLKLYKYEIN